MTIDRRVASLEASLSPTELVLRWLDEAHGFGSLEAYVASLLDRGPEDFPLNRLCREADASARPTARSRSRNREEVDGAVRAALRMTVFRFELIMRINLTAHQLLDRQKLLDAFFSAQLALLAGEPSEARADPAYRRRLALVRDLIITQSHELQAAADARTIAEERYLDGHPALFPATAAAWERQRASTDALVASAVDLAEIDAVDPALPPDAEGAAASVAALVVDLVEPAKSTALDKLDEGRQAFRIATAWLRSKPGVVEPGPATNAPGKGPETPTL